MQTNPTQLTGLMAFTLAALACAPAAWRRRGPWRGLLLAQLACTAEIAIGLRLRLHDAVDLLLRGHGWYASRDALQEPLLGGLLLIVAIGVAALWRSARRDADLARAWLGTGLASMLFVTEAISLHRIDGLMYARVGSVMLIGLGWSAAAALVAGSALHAAARR